jgi:hypothetical protein
MNNKAENPQSSLPVNAVMILEIVKNTVQADGTTANTALASLNNAGDFVDNIFFTFEITKGSAFFLDKNQTKTKTVTKQANPAYVASVNFYDTIPETGSMRAYPTLASDRIATADYTFGQAQQKYALNLIVTSDNAIADGIGTNTVKATLSSDTGSNINQQLLQFELFTSSTTATFGGLPSPQQRATEVDGTASIQISLRSDVDQAVSVICSMLSAPTVTQIITVQFKANATQKPSRIELDVTRDDAAANGKDSNIVTVLLLNDQNAAVLGEKLSLAFDPPNAAAAFIGYSTSEIELTSNPFPITVQLTDNSKRAEAVSVRCVLESNRNIFEVIDTHFTAIVPPPPPPPRYTVTVTAIQNNTPVFSSPNPGDTARVTVMNNGSPVNGVRVNCSILGADKFTFLAFGNSEKPYLTSTGPTTCIGTTHTNGYFDVTFGQGNNSIHVTFSAPYNGITGSYPFSFI